MRINRRLAAGIGAAAIGAAVPVTALAIAAASASADVSNNPGDCQEGSSVTCVKNVLPCPHEYERNGGPLCVYVGPGPRDNDLHAAAKVNGLVCVHAIIGNSGTERREIIRTASCRDSVTVVPGTTNPCSCSTPPPVVTPVPPAEESPASPPAASAPAPAQPVPVATAPTIVNNNTNTSGSPLPAVTH